MKIMNLLKLGRFIGQKEEPSKKKNLIMEIADDPEKFRLEAEIDNGELIIKIKKKQENDPE